MNIHMKGQQEPVDYEYQEPDAPPSEAERLASLIAERDAQYAQRQQHSDRKISELFEQQQTINRTLLQTLAAKNTEPDYSSTGDYFASANPGEYITVEQARKLAEEAARSVVVNTITTGDQAKKAERAREKEIADYFETNMKDLHPFRNQIKEVYDTAIENFPNATVDERFAYAVDIVKKVAVPVARSQQPVSRNPVGSGGNNYASRPVANYDAMGQQSSEHQELVQGVNDSAMAAWVREQREYENHRTAAFDQF
jgi:hypothetical protein